MILVAFYVIFDGGIPTKHSVSQVVGYIDRKSAICVVRDFTGHGRNFKGCYSGARGYFVSTVEADEKVIRSYIRN